MDDETKAGFAEMRRGFEEMRMEMRQGFQAMDRRFETTDAKIDTVRREAGVVAEHLQARLELVAEIVGGNARAIERLTTEQDARFRESEVVLQAAFRQLRRDIEDPRNRR